MIKVRPLSLRPHFFHPKKWTFFASGPRANWGIRVKAKPGLKFGFVLCLALAVPLRAEVRVLLFQKELPKSLDVRSPVTLEIDGGKERRAARVHLRFTPKGIEWSDGREHGVARRIVLRPTGPALRLRTPQGFEADYGGRILLDQPGTPRVINVLDEESFLQSVTAQEIPADWPSEAVKAQLVVGRTFLAKNRGRHRREEADYCDLAHCQVYRGRESRPAVQQAAKDTAELLLTRGGRPAEVFFHSDCGGHTAWSEDVWRGGTAALSGVRDANSGRDFCEGSPHHRWRAEIRSAELAFLLGETSRQRSTLTLLERDRSGRAKTLRWGTRVLSGEEFYLAWGRGRRWHELKSTAFDVQREGDLYVFQGRGLGHGVGLCQHGARGRAQAGFGFREILAAYFPGLELGASPAMKEP